MNPIDPISPNIKPEEVGQKMEAHFFFRPYFKSYLETERDLREGDPEEDAYSRELLEDLQFEGFADLLAAESPLGLGKFFAEELGTKRR